uniref:Calponin-homology (CH) domain-containing protein n=1 Tax=Haemonchus contortus TaxID=6289 RepID=A0A7I4XY83_HAECO
MPLFGLRFSTHDEDERAQKNTFTRWINLHLEEHSSSGRVNDLFEDIKDGVLLCHLIEVLTGEALQVCRTRASKRVHHIANLTTALTVLRRRGLELVNNNASDIADGNPRIVLGLIWQIILHFQIESNMALLREWGWGSTSVQYSRESTPVRSSSPMKSRLTSFLSSGPSTSTESPKVSVKQMKGSVEQVMLRWINSEIAQKLNMHVENMDRDWKDGVLFNALVHRWKPEVVDMEKVRQTEPRENLENAFELAHKHLGINKLLEIDDVLCAKPDKRSIITYVSQFVRTYGRPAPVEEPNLHTEFLEWLAFTSKLDLKNNEQGMYFRVRREFIEYRSLYNTIMATKLNYTIEELALIQERWETIRNNLEATAVNAEKRLPKPYSSLSVWTATGQSLINAPLNLPVENPQKCLVILQKMISEHNRHFIDMAAKMEELNTAVNSGGLGGRPVAAEYVEPLRVRMAALADEAPLKLATLKILYAHYTVLAYLYELESKMRLWSSAESLQLLNRWIMEYTHMEKENPRLKSSRYIEDLKQMLASEPSTKLDGDSMVRSCSRHSDEVLKAFDSMKTHLDTLRSLWVDWERELERLDAIAMTGIANRTNTLQDESEAIRVLEAKFDELAPRLSASARLACNQKMELLRLKVKQLNKFAASNRLVVELMPSTSQIIRKVTNVNEATERIQEIEKNLSQWTSHGAEKELQETYEKMELKRQLNALKKARPQMNAVEHYLAQLQEWLASTDAYDRAKALDVLDLIGKAIDTIETQETGRYVDCERYRAMFRSCTDKVHGHETSPAQNYEEPPIDKAYVLEVMARAELILNRRESNEDELRASLNDMADCEVVLRDWNSKRLRALRERWKAKRQEFELWQKEMDHLQSIAVTVENRQSLKPSLIAELQSIEESCDQMTMTELAHPLRLAIRQLRVVLENSFKERLESLKMAGEEDCTVAHNIVQEVGEELVAFCPQLNERHTEARQVLSHKMELFRRLQNYYDAVKYLRNQNTTWNSITVAEVPSVSTELRTLLERCDSEWQNDASRLREELNGISGSFFELEFDRVNEKLNLLTYEKDKLRDLMRIRLEYLDAVRDFIASADSSIDINQMATPSDSPHLLRDRTKQLCNSVEEKAKRLKRLQDPAEMIISDLSISQLVREFRCHLMGPENENTFGDAARRFETLISKSMPTTDNPQSFLTVTLELMRLEEEESKLFDELNEVAASENDKHERDRLASLYKTRQEERNRSILNYMYAYHDYLNSLFRTYEDNVIQLIHNRAYNELHKFNDGEWKQWKESVGELENALDASMRLRLRPEFADLQRKAFSLDSRISRSIASSAKQKRHEEKLAAKLAQFEMWLNAMEADVDSVEGMPMGDEQISRLSQLLHACLSQQRLVGKLERLNIQNRDHVLQLCQKYYKVLNRLRSYNLDEGALPIHVSTLVHGAQTESQLSISSLASSDFADRPESVQSSYNDGPKSLATAIADYNLLLTYRGELNKLFDEIPSGSDAKNVALENSLHHLLEHLNETASNLQAEIDEEVSISAKEKEVVKELSNLEERVKSRDVSDLNLVYDLDQLQTQMDLLRMISSRPRQFVESDLMDRGGPTSNRTRQKRKVLMMVTNTVTTIIQVVEERLLTIEARSRDPIVQQKLDLVKTNLKKLEEEVIGSPPEEAIDIPTAGKSQQLDLETDIPAELSDKNVPSSDTFAAAVLGVEQALNIAEDIDLKSWDDPSVLSESLSILNRQSAAMDALCNTASELAKSGDVQYLDTISTLQERLLSVKYSLADRLEKLRSEAPYGSVSPSRVDETEKLRDGAVDDFDKLVGKVRSVMTSADAVLSDDSNGPQALLKARDEMKNEEPVLSSLRDIASSKAQLGECDGIDIVSALSEEFDSVRLAIEDRIDELTLQAPLASAAVEDDSSTEVPPGSSVEFHKLVQEVLEATTSAELLLSEESSDVEVLLKARENLKSQDAVLAELSDVATAKAQLGNCTDLDAVSSLSEQFNAVFCALEDRIDELVSEVKLKWKSYNIRRKPYARKMRV